MRIRTKFYSVAILWLISVGHAGCLLPAFEEDPPTECSQGLNSWGLSYEGDETESVYDLAADSDGNLITAGVYDGRLHYGSGQFDKTDGESDAFVAKHGPDGAFQWIHTFDNGFAVTASLVDTFKDERILVAGTFWEMLQIGDNAPLPTKDSGTQNIFLAEYDTNGSLLWSDVITPDKVDPSTLGTDIEELAPSDAAYDRTGNIVLCGTFRLSTQLMSGGTHMFVLKLREDHSQKWLRRYFTTFAPNGENHIEPAGIAFDSKNNVYISGTYGKGDLVFDASNTLLKGLGERLFFAKLSEDNGDPVFARIYDDVTETDQRGAHIIIDDRDNKYVLASNFGVITPIPDNPIASVALEDFVVIKHDENDNIVWARGFGGSGIDRGEKLALGGADRLLVLGMASAEISFERNLISAGNNDIFLAFLNPADGSPAFSTMFGDEADQSGNGLAIGKDKKPYIAGEFAGSLNFGIEPITRGKGSSDLFIAKPCQ